MISIPCDYWKTLFSMQICGYPEIFCNRHTVAFFKLIVLIEVRILFHVTENADRRNTSFPRK